MGIFGSEFRNGIIPMNLFCMTTTFEPDETQFQKYFTSISQQYGCWGNFYTLTDTLDRQSQDKAGFSSFDSPFDFGLMVEKVVQKQLPGSRIEGQQEKRLPVLEGICKYATEHVLLIGKPGSGKSTALTRLLLEKCGNTLHRVSESRELRQITVLIELRYWQSSVLQLIQASFNKHELPLTESEINSLLSQRQLLLLVDGLNELPSEEARRQVAAFRREFSQTPMIFTTRDLGIRGDLGIEKKLEMLPLTETQMRQFVLAYLPEQGEELLRQLRDRVREFGQTPLLLWMLCGLFGKTNTIPANLGMVFRLFTQGYESNIKQDVPIKSDRNWWKPLLEHLAFVMMQGEPVTEFRVTIPKQEVKMVFQEFLKGKVAYADDFALRCLDDLLNHHLIEVGSGEQIQFRHQLLQEYYAAEYLLRLLPSLSDRKLQRDYLNLLKWTESIAIALALVEDEEQAVRVVQLALDVDLMLGSRLAGEVKQEFQEKTTGLIYDLNLPRLLKIRLLGISKSLVAINLLISEIKETESSIYRYTVNALQEIPNKETELIQLLKNKDSLVRICAVSALGSIGANVAIPTLIQTLQDEDSLVRSSVVSALGEIGSDEAVCKVVQALKDTDSSVRICAASALGSIGANVAIPTLIQTLQDEDSLVRSSVVSALGEIGSDEAVCKVVQALKDTDSSVRICAASALGSIGANVAIPTLIQTLQDEDSLVRSAVVSALGEIGSDEAVCEVVQALQDTDSSVRCDAISVLENSCYHLPEDILIEALRNKDSQVRNYALSTLQEQEFDKDVILNVLHQAIDNAPIDVQEALNEIYEELYEENEYEQGWIRWSNY
jgi:HEAT repeat protein